MNLNKENVRRIQGLILFTILLVTACFHLYLFRYPFASAE